MISHGKDIKIFTGNANPALAQEICKIIGADSLAYLRKERLLEISGGRQYCHGCFTGEYPMEPPKEDIRGEHENFKRGEDSKVK